MSKTSLFEVIKKEINKQWHVPEEDIISCNWKLVHNSLSGGGCTDDLEVEVEVSRVAEEAWYCVSTYGNLRGKCGEGSHCHIVFNIGLPLIRTDSIYGYKTELYEALIREKHRG